MLASPALSGRSEEDSPEGVVARVVRMSEWRIRKAAVCRRVGSEVVGFWVERKEESQMGDAGRCFWVDRAVERGVRRA